jgi:hypothetical protein
LLHDVLMDWQRTRFGVLEGPGIGRELHGNETVALLDVVATEQCDLSCSRSAVSTEPLHPPASRLEWTSGVCAVVVAKLDRLAAMSTSSTA